MPKLTTLEYLEKVDHALVHLDTGDQFRLAELNNIRAPIRIAIGALERDEEGAEDIAQEIIELVRDRIDALCIDLESAGLHDYWRNLTKTHEGQKGT